jgi:hypothetical protein
MSIVNVVKFGERFINTFSLEKITSNPEDSIFMPTPSEALKKERVET